MTRYEWSQAPGFTDGARMALDKMSDEDLEILNPFVLDHCFKYKQRVERIAEITGMSPQASRDSVQNYDVCVTINAVNAMHNNMLAIHREIHPAPSTDGWRDSQ